MKRVLAVVLLALRCHRAHGTGEATEAASGSEATDGGAPREVCTPEQGSTGVDATSPARSLEAAFADASVRLRADYDAPDGPQVYLQLGAAPERVRKLWVQEPYGSIQSLQGAEGLALYASGIPTLGGWGFVAWSNRKTPAFHVDVVDADVVRIGSRVVYVAKDCNVHVFDVELGTHRVGPSVMCHATLSARGSAVVVGTAYPDDDVTQGFAFAKSGFDPATFAAVSKPCLHAVGATCIRFEGESKKSLDEDPPALETQPAELQGFDVIDGSGAVLQHGEIRSERCAASAQVQVWKNADGTELALLADVSPTAGATLVRVRDGGVTVRRVAAAEWLDQRTIPELQIMVPYETDPAGVAELIAARQQDAAAAARETLRWLDVTARRP